MGWIFPPTEYHDDRDDAAQSGEAMGRALLKLMRLLRKSPERCEALRSAVRKIADH